jgi:hypothetical protein
MRGGGAGSWGVIVDATFQTYPTFTASGSLITITTTDSAMMGNIITAHAKHIFDWDSLRAGQYYTISNNGPAGQSMSLITIFLLGSVADATKAIQPFIDNVKSLGANVTAEPVTEFPIKDLTGSDSIVAGNVVFGSRLIPASVFCHTPEFIGEGYVQLLQTVGSTYVLISYFPLHFVLTLEMQHCWPSCSRRSVFA